MKATKLNPDVLKDAARRRAALITAEVQMTICDAFAHRMRRVVRRVTGLKDGLLTWHRGLAGAFSISAEHVDGLHIRVRSVIRGAHNADPAAPDVRYVIEVCGAGGDLTEREATGVIKLLLNHKLPGTDPVRKTDG